MKPTKRPLYLDRETIRVIRALTHAEQAAVLGGYADSGAAVCPARPAAGGGG